MPAPPRSMTVIPTRRGLGTRPTARITPHPARRPLSLAFVNQVSARGGGLVDATDMRGFRLFIARCAAARGGWLRRAASWRRVGVSPSGCRPHSLVAAGAAGIWTSRWPCAAARFGLTGAGAGADAGASCARPRERLSGLRRCRRDRVCRRSVRRRGNAPRRRAGSWISHHRPHAGDRGADQPSFVCGLHHQAPSAARRRQSATSMCHRALPSRRRPIPATVTPLRPRRRHGASVTSTAAATRSRFGPRPVPGARQASCTWSWSP